MSCKISINAILLSSFILSGCNDSDTKISNNDSSKIKIENVDKNMSIPKSDIKVLEKKVEKEIVKKVPKEKVLSVHEKKQRFKDILVPITIEIYHELEMTYKRIKIDIKNNTNKVEIEKLKKEYKAKSNDELLHALKPHPISIVLAQAAAESAWLTSRFTKEANNIFGVWSFNKNEPRIAASGLRGDKTIYLKKYSSLREAVHDYYKNIGKNWAYKTFRYQRTISEDPHVLVDHLGSYSEKKEAYIKLLKSMIKYNKFEKYDIKGELDIVEPKKIITVKSEDLNITKDHNTTIPKINKDENVSIEKMVPIKNKSIVIEKPVIVTNELNITQSNDN